MKDHILHTVTFRFAFYSAMSGILLIMGIYCWSGMKKAYRKAEVLPLQVSIAIWSLDITHALVVILAALQSVWLLPINKMIALTGGLVMWAMGVTTMLAGMIQFRSLRKISGLDILRLVSAGIYRWSRNPQHVGWYLILLGTSLMGRSGLAFLFTIVAVLLMHCYITRMEEPYLERIFGENYHSYKSKTARYIGRPKE